MNRRLFWQLNISLLVVSLGVFSVLHYLSSQITVNMTVMDTPYQQRLGIYAQEADRVMQAGDHQGVLALTRKIRNELGVWSAVVLEDNTIIADEVPPDHLNRSLGFQRLVNWPIHEFMRDVLVGFPMPEHQASFVVELPASMYPRGNTALVHNLLTIIIPSLLLTCFCWFFYRYLMKPLEALNNGTLRLAQGDLKARVLPDISAKRQDELTQIAASFDRMAERVECLVNSQRQLLGDLSHELRTPLTRLELALDICEEEQERAETLLPRLRREMQQMHQLVEDALTIAWLDGEPEIDCSDEFNLSTLLDLICDDAEFEYPQRQIERQYDYLLPVESSSQQALAQVVENALRNALKYSFPDQPVQISCERQQGDYLIKVSDRGPGVPEDCLEKIFEPFYKTDKARTREVGGFGLGLALCKRQMTAIGGTIEAKGNVFSGLDIVMILPAESAEAVV